MERPNLNPSIFDDPDRLPDPPQHTTFGVLGALGRLLRTLCFSGPILFARLTWRVLRMPVHPVRARADSADTDARSLLVRIIGPLVFRMMFVTLLALGTVFGIVHLMTHPMTSPDLNVAPICPGLLVEPVRLQAVDGPIVSAWQIHALDERQVMAHKDVAARAKWPAVILAPDQRGDGHDLDRFIRPLHEQGYIVLVVRLRGTDGETARTFGLLERQDIAAAVHHLRSRPHVDASRISVLGTGTGATAALLARRDDPAIHRVIAYSPVTDFDQVLTTAVTPNWLRPACRWAFEMTQQVDVEDLNTAALTYVLAPSAVVIPHPPARGREFDRVATVLRGESVASARE